VSRRKAIRGLVPGLSFTLNDDHGHTVHGDSYAGKVVLLYFGFSNCKLACPETLSKLAAALHRIGPQAQNVRVLFVSVDPHRDTPQKLAAYTRSFAPQMIGLTGTQDQLRRVARRYRVAYSYGKDYPRGSYAVYHSSAVFVFDREGRARLLVQGKDSVAAVAADLKRLLGTS
jgi:protein SCO1/2